MWDDDDGGERSYDQTKSADMREKKKTNNKSVSELMSMLPATADRSTRRFVTWLQGREPDRIDWDEDTFQVIIDGVRKNNSSLVDIITFLVDRSARIGEKMYATSHTSGRFEGIPIGTTHFIEAVGQELHSDGFIEQTPYDDDTYGDHVEKLAAFLDSNYHMPREKIKEVMLISSGERRRMHYETREESEKAARKAERQREKTEKEREDIKKVMKKVQEEEEKNTREQVQKKLRESQSRQLEEMHAEMPHELAMAKLRTPKKKKKPEITKRGVTEKRVIEKMKKKGLPKWATEKNVGKTLLEQMNEKDWWNKDNPLVRMGTAIHNKAYKVSQRKDLTQEEKSDEIQRIIDQITERHKTLQSHRDATKAKKRLTTKADDDDDDDGVYELVGKSDDDDDDVDDEMAELMDIGLALFEEEERKEKEEAEKLDVATGGDDHDDDDGAFMG